MAFKSNVPQKMKQTKLSEREIGRQLGISRAMISLLIHGEFPERNARDTLLALCEFFNCQLSELFVYEVNE